MESITSGMDSLLLSEKKIETETHDKNTKIVKLRFTRKQYETFRDACKIFELVSADKGFNDFVQKALDADIKVPTITRHFIKPIVDAPTMIPMKIPKSTAQSNEPKRQTYFTAPIDVTQKCTKLYSHVKDNVSLKHDMKDGKTCLTDVRVMVGKYFSTKNLKTEDGVILDDFILDLASESINSHNDVLQRINGAYVIPKGDRKVMSGIVNEVAFGTF